MKPFWGDLFYDGPDIEILRAPEINRNYESNISGIHIIGDLSGVPLLKNAVNMGHDLIEKIGPTLKSAELAEDEYHLVIVGAGGAGLAAALAAKDMGLRYLVIEQKIPGNTIESFFKGKEIFAEPEALPNRSRLWVEHSVKEELLDHWNKTIREEDLNVHQNEQLTGITREGARFVAETSKTNYKCSKIVLSMGRSGTPRMLDVPGEDLAKVHYVLADPDDFTDQKIAIVGGGDTSLEAAIALAPHNDVTLIVRAKSITRAQKANIERVKSLVDSGKIKLSAQSAVTAIRENEIDIKTGDAQQTLANDHLFIMIGSTPPDKFLKKLRVRNIGDWSLRKFLFLVAFSALVFVL